jgi:hypothetical protein
MKRHSAFLTALAVAALLPLSSIAAEPAPAAAAATAKAKKADKPCEPATASRIRKSKADDCKKDMPPAGTYTKEDLDSTGQTDTGEALRRLDPRFH